MCKWAVDHWENCGDPTCPKNMAAADYEKRSANLDNIILNNAGEEFLKTVQKIASSIYPNGWKGEEEK